jgi:hypothetical protein
MPKRAKKKYTAPKSKPVTQNDNSKPSYRQNTPYDFQKAVQPDKIVPKQIFDGYKGK